MSVRKHIENFVEVYNRPASAVYPLYADTLDWIEMPSGRHGGRDELFAALKGVRDAITDMKLRVISIVANEHDGLLESEWTGKMVADGSPIKARVLWIFSFKDGKISKEHDYSCPAG